MRDLTRLPHQLDRERGACRVVIETPQGGRAKYDYDPQADLFILAKMLPAGMAFPADFGFAPSTRGGDGDPLDVMVLSDEPGVVGSLVTVRLIGVLKADQSMDGSTERNDRLLAVPVLAHRRANVRDLDDLGPTLIEDLERFWVDKARAEGKAFRILGRGGSAAAIELIVQASVGPV